MLNGARWPPRITKSKHMNMGGNNRNHVRRHPFKTICFARGHLLANMAQEIVASLTEMHRRHHTQPGGLLATRSRNLTGSPIQNDARMPPCKAMLYERGPHHKLDTRDYNIASLIKALGTSCSMVPGGVLVTRSRNRKPHSKWCQKASLRNDALSEETSSQT
jgi:hypothetical protein